MSLYTIYHAMIKRAQDITVNKGDTLGGISQRTGHSVQQLMNWNDITDSNKINVGQVLKTYPGQWKVNAGNTLSGIGKQLGYTEQQMVDANKDIRPEALSVGQFIKLPTSSSANTGAAATGTAAKPAAANTAKPAATAATKTVYTPPSNEYPDKAAALEIIHGIETAYGTNVKKNPASSAEGHTQVTDATWNYMTGKRKDLTANGETKANLNNKEYAFKFSGAYIDDLAVRFYKVNGRWPTMEELLASYNGGLAGRKSKDALDYSRDAMSKKYYTDRNLAIPSYVQEHGTD